MVGEVVLGVAQLSNLHEIQHISWSIAELQKQIASGRKAVVDLVAISLSRRAHRLIQIKSSIAQTISEIEVGVTGADTIYALIEQMKTLALSAKQESTPEGRSILQTEFNDLREQIDHLTRDASYAGISLLSSNSSSTVTLDDSGSSYTVTGFDSSATGLGIAEATDWSVGSFTQAKANIDASIAQLDTAKITMESTERALAASLEFLATREAFTENLIANLDEGVSKLVDLDLDRAGAEFLALQTRQQLAIVGMSILQGQTELIVKTLEPANYRYGENRSIGSVNR